MFKWTKLLWKVGLVVSPLLAALGVNVVWPATFDGLNENLVLSVCALLTGLVAGVRNLVKNWDKIGRDDSGGASLAIVAILLLLMLSGCAVYRVGFVDGTDGSATTITDLVPLGMKRDLSAAQAKYEWDAKGAGQWDVGARAQGTDGTAIVEMMKAMTELTGAAAKVLTQGQPEMRAAPLTLKGVP
jgi:hypothetical protein